MPSISGDMSLLPLTKKNVFHESFSQINPKENSKWPALDHMTVLIQSLGPRHSVYQGFTKGEPFAYCDQEYGFYFQKEEGEAALNNR